ncbi:MAG: hypothetical protein JW761_02895 [Prolixibacteraceae bacterium]|nr:hypothetical protein [Prolixibacteraceae bacterium]
MRYFGIVVFLVTVQTSFSQVEGEIPFIRHLINKGYYNEAVYLINQNTFYSKQDQQDSIHYLHGWAHYSLKNLEQSTLSFLKVQKESPFYLKSHFFAGYNQTHLGNYQEAEKIWRQILVQNDPYLSLLNFELSGLEMLQGNWEKAKAQLELVNPENAILNEQVAALGKIYQEHKTHRSKSPVLAGIMSGIIPGSGKIYAGKTGAGIASMIGTVGFGLITWENYHKRGITNAKTIIFGSIFVVTYVSNIYGSVVSVKIIENEYKNAVHNQILFQLHIPLRNFFE